MSTAAERALARIETIERDVVAWLRFCAIAAALLAFYAVAWNLADIDPARLIRGLPRLWGWILKAWPPKLDELPIFIERTAQTVAMAALGTTLATILALPLAIMASRNVTPLPILYYPTRWFLNGLRSIDSFIFALLFVAAVGLGPFAGVLGIALHTWGSAARLFSDSIENADLAPYEAVRATGAGRSTAIAFALLPDLLPVLLSTTLFWWEFNIRASTVLGVIGAGGIGQELMNSMNLLDFQRLFTILAIILATVTLIDQACAWLRRWLVQS